jgi:hypothetical protein
VIDGDGIDGPSRSRRNSVANSAMKSLACVNRSSVMLNHAA